MAQNLDADKPFLEDLNQIRNRVDEIFRNRGLTATPERLDRIAGEIERGERGFVDLRISLRPYAKTNADAGIPDGSGGGDRGVRGYLEDNFPSFVWAVDDPELGPILEQAANEDWSPTRIQGALEATAWWKETSATARQARLTQENDPAEWQRQLNAEKETIRQQATALGLSLSDSQMTKVATDSLTLGFSQQQLEQAIFANSNLEKITAEQITQGQVGGSLSEIERQVEVLGAQWMLNIPDENKLQWAKQILTGEKTLDSFASYAQTMARKNLPFIADLFDQGLTAQDVLSPYQTTVAQQLEMTPAEVDFTDGRWQKVLKSREEDGTTRLATQSEIKANVRQEFADEWAQTSNARQAATQMTTQLASIFGRR